MPITLFDKIGPEFISKAITDFYIRAFQDPLIGHFFFNKDREELTSKQIQFTSKLLGAQSINYEGKPLGEAHHNLRIRKVHFDRRQQVMRETLEELGLNQELSNAWLELERKLSSLILNKKKTDR